MTGASRQRLRTGAPVAGRLRALSPIAARIAGPDVKAFVRWGFYGYLFSIPLEYPDRTIPLEVHTLTGSIFLLIALTQPRVVFRRPPIAFWCMAMYLWSYVAHGLFSDHVPEVAKLFFNYLLVTILFWVGHNLMRSERVARGALVSFTAGCAVVAALNVAGIATRVVVSDQTARSIVFGQNADVLGANMALGLVMLMVVTFDGRQSIARPRVILGAVVALVIAKSLMLVGSRGAILGVVAGVVSFTCWSGNLRTFARNFGIAVAAGAALSIVVYRSDSLMKRYEKTFETGSMSGREEIYPEAWRLFAERPLFGWGPIDTQYELAMRTAGFTIGEHNADGVSASQSREMHNLLLEILASMGIVGGLPLLLCLVASFGAAWRARAGPRGTGPFTLLVVALVLSMGINWSASKQLWFILAFATASGSIVLTRRGHGVPIRARAA